MLYTKQEQLKTFLDEAGVQESTPEEKLTLKQKDVAGKEGDVTVLAAQ
jgi:hypothetical protein